MDYLSQNGSYSDYEVLLCYGYQAMSPTLPPGDYKLLAERYGWANFLLMESVSVEMPQSGSELLFGPELFRT